MDAIAGDVTVPLYSCRNVVLGVVVLVEAAALAAVLYQSVLTEPVGLPESQLGLAAFATVLGDSAFRTALLNTLLLAIGMIAIALPLGTAMAFAIARTDVPGRRWFEPVIVATIFVPTIIVGIGYASLLGPDGFLPGPANSTSAALVLLILVAGFVHAPYVYLCAAAALRTLGPEAEEAARVAGATPWKALSGVTLPAMAPWLAVAAALVFVLGVEQFGLPLAIGEPLGAMVLTTYLYQNAAHFGSAPHPFMAVAAVAMIALAAPLAVLQQVMLRRTRRPASRAGHTRTAPQKLGRWRWPAFAAMVLWLLLALVLPLGALLLRSMLGAWDASVSLADALTFDNYRALFEESAVVRGIGNTLCVGLVGGALAVLCYAAIAYGMREPHRPRDAAADALVAAPRIAAPLIFGLAILLVFFACRPLAHFQMTMVSIWLAYTLLWLTYGTQLVSHALARVSPALEDAARSMGAERKRVARDVTLPLLRHGLFAAWILIVLLFVREYAAGVLLFGSGTEVIGTLVVSLWRNGAIQLAAPLAMIHLAIIGIIVAVAFRFGVRPHG